ncbi:MAG: nucleotidyltransferase family protein, partial [Clostridiales bacterium]|nr:nucleotidyltransferase family protein [Clostridiales bacterium]
MKICAIICEYNPFHNGHLYQLNLARERSDSDAIVCLMSGDFVQRGEASIMDKRIRANHALQAGADVVVELPTVFATSPAELFASGAIKLLSSIPTVNTLCFGAETADKLAFKSASKYLADEP